MKKLKVLLTSLLLFLLLLSCEFNSNKNGNPEKPEVPSKKVVHTNTATTEFTGLPMTADGWTDLSAIVKDINLYNDCRIVYVSSSGNDSSAQIYSPSDSEVAENPFDPAGPISPFATFTAAYEMMRDGYPDIMLLKRGDIWTEDMPQGRNGWRKSGKSQKERMIIGAYGPLSAARPKLGSFIGRNKMHNIVLADLELSDSWRSVHLEGSIQHFLIEGCYMPPATETGMVVQNHNNIDGGVDYLAIRRNVIADRHRPANTTALTQGFYIDDSVNLLIEENIFDNNGEDESGQPNSTRDLRSHNSYVMLGKGIGERHIWRYNISSRSCSHAIQAGSGGLIKANLLVENPIGIQASRVDEWWDSGFSADIRENVILHGTDISPQNRRGWGISIQNSHQTVVVDNIIGANDKSGSPFGIRVRALFRADKQMYVRDLTIKNNIIHNWNGSTVGDSKGIAFYCNEYDATKVYSHGTNPDNYIRDIKITGNIITTENPGLGLIQLPHAGLVSQSANNVFYGTIAPEQLFRINGTYYNLSGYKGMISDTTSTFSKTSPERNYGILDYLTHNGKTATFDSFYAKLRLQRKGNWDSAYTAVPIINFVRESFGRAPVK